MNAAYYIDFFDTFEAITEPLDDRCKRIAYLKLIDGFSEREIGEEIGLCSSRVNQLWNINILPVLKCSFGQAQADLSRD